MSGHSRGGFTIVELLVAIVVLTAGILAVASSTIFTTRNLTRSRLATSASLLGTAKIEELIGYAAATSPPCTSPRFASSASPVTTNGITVTWTVPASGSLRTVQVRARYNLGAQGFRTDTLTARIAC